MSSTSIQAKMFKAVSADTAAVAALQTTAGAGDFTLTSSSVSDGSNMATTVTLTSAGNISSVNFTITGTDENGNAVTETRLGPNANTVTTTEAFLTVTSVSVDAAVGTNTSVGFSATSTTKGRPIDVDLWAGFHVFSVTEGRDSGLSSTPKLQTEQACTTASINLDP